jgi:hypothetical protein
MIVCKSWANLTASFCNGLQRAFISVTGRCVDRDVRTKEFCDQDLNECLLPLLWRMEQVVSLVLSDSNTKLDDTRPDVSQFALTVDLVIRMAVNGGDNILFARRGVRFGVSTVCG